VDDGLAIRVLGPMEVSLAGEPVALGGPRVRALLVYLTLHRASPVPTDRILEDLWSDGADDSARRSLHTQISALRGRLPTSSGPIIVRDPAGYHLDTFGLWIDLDEFERLSRAALAEADGEAAARALELWRGEPLGEVAHETWAQGAVAELQERRMQLLQIHLDAQMRGGRHAELIPELRALVEEHPFAEPLWERLLLALYRSGRQTDALDAFRQLEDTLREELGLEPGPTLQDLQRQMLLHDPSLRPASTSPHEVPASLTTFIGRDAEMGWLASLLDDHRLVTVLGPGGVGKTRIVTELAHRQRGRWPGGIWFVDLAPVREDGRVLEVVADRLGVSAPPGSELSAIRTSVDGRRTLLVLDNCEHLRVEVARVAADLLRAAPKCRIVVTSRVALGVAGELTWTLPPLEVPEHDEDVLAAESDAVRLFADRAASVRPAFRLGSRNLSTVARLCQRLDGLPLALELAATRLRSMSVSEIATYLDKDQAFLRSPDPNVDDRHRTLTAVLDWSTELLDPTAREIHARLSILPGSFASGLAAAICNMPESEIIDHLDTLVANSLLTADTSGPHTRYRMLEVVRGHAATRLDRSGGRPDAELALLQWAVETTQLGALEPASAEQPQGLHLIPAGWVRELAAEQHNLRAALAAASHDPETGLRVAIRLTRYWFANAGDPDMGTGSTLPAVREGIEWLERLLALPGIEPRRRDAALVAVGFLRGISGDKQQALSELLVVRDRLDTRGQLRTAAWACLYAATASWGIAPSTTTRQLYRDAQDRFEHVGDFEGQVLLGPLLLARALADDDHAEASAVVDHFLAITDDVIAPSVTAYRQFLQGHLGLLDGDEQRAGAHLRELYERLPTTRDPVTTTLILTASAWWAALAGHAPTARGLLTFSTSVEARNGFELPFAAPVRIRAERALRERPDLPGSPEIATSWTPTTLTEAFHATRSLLTSRDTTDTPLTSGDGPRHAD
jgi:predicted ATPase/DNA-binding SARP family transcriptional activator